MLFLHQLKWLCICTLRYSTVNDSARYVWVVVFVVIRTRDTTFTYLPTWAFFLDWQTKTYLRYDTARYDTISSVLVEKCQKNPGITLRDVRG